jgi:hypothetical protein
MNPELIERLQQEKENLEQQMLDVLKRNGMVQVHLAYWKQISDVLKEVAPSPPTTTTTTAAD